MKLRRGLVVRDVNDRAVGVVAAVADSSFAVRVNGSHLWLLGDAIFYVAENAAKLICNADDIRRYEVRAGNHHHSDSGNAAG